MLSQMRKRLRIQGEDCLKDGKLKVMYAACSASKACLERMIRDVTCVQETIPLSMVQNFDMMDDGDPEVPPQFVCETCEERCIPEYYKGVYGYEYRIEDRLGERKVEGRSK